MKDLGNFILDKCILIFDAEQVYFKLQATNLKHKTLNPKPQQKVGFSKILNPKP